MQQALAEAKKAAAQGEVPVGAVLVDGVSGKIVASAHNLTEKMNDATAHAEMIVLREGGKIISSPRLAGCDLYVTLEPCPMCAAAIALARLRRVYFGAYDPKGGGVDHGPRIFHHATCHHKPEIYGGIEEQSCAALMKDFFKDKRA